MKILTIYQSEDGTRFDTEIKCMEYESMCKQVAEIMDKLHPRPEDVYFCNGSGYIQHTDPKDVQVEFCKYLLTKDPELKAAEQIVKGEDVDISWIGRVCHVSGKCIDSAIFRLSCINYTSKREYGQPFFVRNESNCKDLQLN